ncbi:hypothetical protein PHACT_12405 [Pseudohongiella acticola]|uniref:Uncharacterized protein n=1 Tax=Pseudohongiella acticola TaxID=1524254 RepID=A0A1E8CG16_9GAMM|nr:hypothetical protein [Pseudohongiella acticola]OFE11353.1 hypothetical protein PHACT_12405 [Pseudohongiella acticola]
MRVMSSLVIRAALVLLVNGLMITSISAQSGDRLLRPAPGAGTPVIPFMEGWYGNEDGSVTLSFGYQNRNREPVRIPAGANNRIEPQGLGDMQPEFFLPGRHHGVFAVTIPADMDGTTVWWHLISEGEELKVPGERGSTAYELDRNPRPQGSVQPLVGFSESGPVGVGPEGIVSEQVVEASIDEPVTLEVWTNDPSKHDPSDPRYAKPLDSRVSWYLHQGPGEVDFIAHESMPFLDTRPATPLSRNAPPQHAVAVKESVGPARVTASFSEPGEYLIRARLDNWEASDSDALDQCCWSNAYQRVRVIE